MANLNSSSTVAGAYGNVGPQPYVDPFAGVTEAAFAGAQQIFDAEKQRKKEEEDKRRQELRDKALNLQIENSEFDLNKKMDEFEQEELKIETNEQILLNEHSINIAKDNAEEGAKAVNVAGSIIKDIPLEGEVKIGSLVVARDGKWVIDNDTKNQLAKTIQEEAGKMESNTDVASQYLEDSPTLGTKKNTELFAVAKSIESNGYKIDSYNSKTGMPDYAVTIPDPKNPGKTKEIIIKGGNLEAYFKGADAENSYSTITGELLPELLKDGVLQDGDLRTLRLSASNKFKTAAQRLQYLNSIGASDELMQKYDDYYKDGIISPEEASNISQEEVTEAFMGMVQNQYKEIIGGLTTKEQKDRVALKDAEIKLKISEKKLNQGPKPTEKQIEQNRVNNHVNAITDPNNIAFGRWDSVEGIGNINQIITPGETYTDGGETVVATGFVLVPKSGNPVRLGVEESEDGQFTLPLESINAVRNFAGGTPIIPKSNKYLNEPTVQKGTDRPVKLEGENQEAYAARYGAWKRHNPNWKPKTKKKSETEAANVATGTTPAAGESNPVIDNVITDSGLKDVDYGQSVKLPSDTSKVSKKSLDSHNHWVTKLEEQANKDVVSEKSIRHLADKAKTAKEQIVKEQFESETDAISTIENDLNRKNKTLKQLKKYPKRNADKISTLEGEISEMNADLESSKAELENLKKG